MYESLKPCSICLQTIHGEVSPLEIVRIHVAETLADHSWDFSRIADLCARYITEQTFREVRPFIKRYGDWSTSGVSAPAAIVRLIDEMMPAPGLVRPRCASCRCELTPGMSLTRVVRFWFCSECKPLGSGRCSRCKRPEQRLRRVVGSRRYCIPCVEADERLWQPCPRCGVVSAADPRAPLTCETCVTAPRRPRRALHRIWECAGCSDTSRSARCEACFLRAWYEITFEPVPALYPLRDRLIERVIDKKNGGQNIEILTGAMGDAWRDLVRLDGNVDEAWLQQFSSLARSAVREHLVAVGLIPNQTRLEIVGLKLELLLTNAEGTVAAEDLTILKRFVRWEMIKRDRTASASDIVARDRGRGRPSTLKALLDICRDLHAHQRCLREVTQGELDALLTPSNGRLVPFFTWASRRRILAVTPHFHEHSETYTVDDPAYRRELLDRLLKDPLIPLWLRVAGLLIACGFQAARVVKLREEYFVDGEAMRIQFANIDVDLDDRVAALVRRLLQIGDRRLGPARRRRSPGWLFPGLRANRPLETHRLRMALLEIGFRVTPMRNAFFLLVGQDLTGLIAEKTSLGLSDSVIKRWRRASNGRWAPYPDLRAHVMMPGEDDYSDSVR